MSMYVSLFGLLSSLKEVLQMKLGLQELMLLVGRTLLRELRMVITLALWTIVGDFSLNISKW